MGTDIHLHIIYRQIREFKHSDISGLNTIAGEWRHANWNGEFSIRRYGLFRLLGLYNYDYKVVPLRGIDDDMMGCLNEEPMDPDCHSYGWCTTQELEECLNAYRDMVSEFWRRKGEAEKVEEILNLSDNVEWWSLLDYMRRLEQGGYYECRAVYCFDN